MGKIILKEAVKREPGYIYYIDKEGNICRAESCIGKKVKKKAKTVKKKTKKK